MCNGELSPKAFSELVIPATELKNELEGMEKKLDAVCDGECSSKALSLIYIFFLLCSESGIYKE